MAEDRNYYILLDVITDTLTLENAAAALTAYTAISTRIYKLQKLLADIGKPGVGLGKKWRSGMNRYYNMVINDLKLELAEIENTLDNLYTEYVNDKSNDSLPE